MGTFLFLAGPKAAGKSWLADIANREFDVEYLDFDAIILDLIAEGHTPHPTSGWLEHVEPVILDALREHDVVSAEVTGAWDSDYTLARHIEEHGHRVLRIRITAPLDETIARLLARTTRKVPVTADEARAEYEQGQSRMAHEAWDLVFDTTGAKRPTDASAALHGLLESA